MYRVNSLRGESGFCSNGSHSCSLQRLGDVLNESGNAEGRKSILHVQQLHGALMIWVLFLALLPGRWCQASLLKLASQRQSETECCLLSGCLMAEAMED